MCSCHALMSLKHWAFVTRPVFLHLYCLHACVYKTNFEKIIYSGVQKPGTTCQFFSFFDSLLLNEMNDGKVNTVTSVK